MKNTFELNTVSNTFNYFYLTRGMQEEDHYVKVKVDKDVVADSDLCNGNPTSSKCTFRV